MLLRKFQEAHREIFQSGQPWTAMALQIINLISNAHQISLEKLLKQKKAHGLEWKRPCCAKLFEGEHVDLGAIIARSNTNTRSICWSRYLIKINGLWTPVEGLDRWGKEVAADVRPQMIDPDLDLETVVEAEAVGVNLREKEVAVLVALTEETGDIGLEGTDDWIDLDNLNYRVEDFESEFNGFEYSGYFSYRIQNFRFESIRLDSEAIATDPIVQKVYLRSEHII
ncbi:hypothetical protein F511_41371 [Dorcoceras hygrometricum]|uniref:Uncharacterized protein n=1 Tax=Dorcoceras hygrometricum TaxID=472368 RepID=A0A2Z7C436_9LAMI|nr:hypothetical protein F511_41371 [Dorcoceras hygrometricum]